MTHLERIRTALAGRKRPAVFAHRGNSAQCPENTMAAFRRAFADGADAVETDLHVSADGEFICIHDATIDRTTNGSGRVREMTVEQLKTFSAAHGRPDFTEETIPTLRELLRALPESVYLGLELKSDDFLDAVVCRRLHALLEDTGALGRVFALSFNQARIDAVRRFTPDIPTGLITLFKLLPPSSGEFVGPLWPVLFANPFYVAWAHRRGQLVCPLDPTPEPRLWYYKLLQCDAVMTNDPALTLSRLGRRPEGAAGKPR